MKNVPRFCLLSSLPAVILTLGVLSSLSPASAAVLVNYTFVSGTNSTAAADPNVGASVITSNIGTVGTDSGFSAAGNAFVRANATQSTQAGAITEADYFEFTLTPQAGFEVDLTSFSLTVGNQTSTALSFTSSYFVRTSLDGYASNIAITSTGGTTTSLGGVASRSTTSNSTAVSDSVVFNVAGSQYQNLTTPVTFRIYLYDTGSGAAPDSSQSISRFDNVQVSGNVSAVPEPDTCLLGLVGGALVLSVRRKREGGLA